jgi:hypothetical protein
VKQGCLSWGIQREGKPITQVRYFDNFQEKPYKVLAKELPVSSMLTVARKLYKVGEISERDLYYLSRKFKEIIKEGIDK